MVKEHYVQKMQQARTSNVRQLHSLKLLVSGLDIDKSLFTPEPAESVFGKWFYGEAKPLWSDYCRHSLNDIEETLVEFHAHFSKIYAIYYGKSSGTLLGLFGLRSKPTDAHHASAQHHYEAMIALSDRLKQQVNVLASILAKMPNETFSQLAHLPVKHLMTS
ncbi:MAG: hypothetical protein PF439_08270 [Helicobacteraceae bacterium]|jgi:hypothetical protein|nr:hypothetical protein [Helicobacteraceae bacterium]